MLAGLTKVCSRRPIGTGDKVVNRAIFLLLIVMLLGAQTLLAQRGRGRHGGAGQTSQSPGAQPDNGDMGDFKRAVALQATEDQTSQFRSMLRKTGSTQKRSEEHT